MTQLDDILSSIGSSNRTERIKAAMNGGMSFPAAAAYVDGEMSAERHAMLKAILLIFGKVTGQIEDSEDTHRLR